MSVLNCMIVVVTEPSGGKEEKTPARTAESNIEEKTTFWRRTAFLNRIEVSSCLIAEEVREWENKSKYQSDDETSRIVFETEKRKSNEVKIGTTCCIAHGTTIQVEGHTFIENISH